VAECVTGRLFNGNSFATSVACDDTGVANTGTIHDTAVQVITKYSFRTASIWLLTLASVIKCCVIVKPLTSFGFCLAGLFFGNYSGTPEENFCEFFGNILQDGCPL